VNLTVAHPIRLFLSSDDQQLVERVVERCAQAGKRGVTIVTGDWNVHLSMAGDTCTSDASDPPPPYSWVTSGSCCPLGALLYIEQPAPTPMAVEVEADGEVCNIACYEGDQEKNAAAALGVDADWVEGFIVAVDRSPIAIGSQSQDFWRGFAVGAAVRVQLNLS
jgi:hypothetical protein